MKRLFVFCLVFCHGCAMPELGDSQAELLLEDIIAPVGQSRLGKATGEPLIKEIRYSAGGRTYRADLYLPAGSKHSAMIIIPGLNEYGREDERLVRLSTSLARVGFIIMIPDIPMNRLLKIHPDNAMDVTAAYLQLLEVRRHYAVNNSGLGAICYGAGPALSALRALAPDAAPDYIVTIGAYYDLKDLLVYYTTGTIGGPSEPSTTEQSDRTPQERFKWILALSLSDFLSHEEDRQALARHSRWLLEKPYIVHASAPELVGVDGTNLVNLLMNEDPGRFGQLYNSLSPALRTTLERLNPATYDLSGMNTKAVLIHGVDDNVIPVSHSRRLARALESAEVEMHELHGLNHVTFEISGNNLEKVVGIADAILALKDR